MRQQKYRQGDVTLVQVETETRGANHGLKKKAEANGRVILVAGEQTGHNHEMVMEVAEVFADTRLPTGHQTLVVKEPTVNKGDFIEGRVLETLKDKSIRFQRTDGLIMRFMPSDIEIHHNGAKVLRAYSPLMHPEHDAVPVSPGTYRVIQHHTVTSRGRRQIVAD